MQTKFIEASNSFNYGKFMVGRFDQEEWKRRSALPGYSDDVLLRRVGWNLDFMLVQDLQTGEGSLFKLTGNAEADLSNHRIWVCVLFEPFLKFLYDSYKTTDRREAWWSNLPEHVELEAEAAFAGYRRPGPGRV